MRLDWGGLLDGKRAFRVIGTPKVYHTIKLNNVSGVLLRLQDGGVLEIDGVIIDHGDSTATIEGATNDLDQEDYSVAGD